MTDNVPITRTMSWCLPFAGKSDRNLWVFLTDIDISLAEPVPMSVGEVVVSACRDTIIRCVVPNSKDGKELEIKAEGFHGIGGDFSKMHAQVGDAAVPSSRVSGCR